MIRFMLANRGRMSAGRLSSRVLYMLVAITVLVFGFFYIIGFDTPFEDDPLFNAPLLTDLLLALVCLITLIALLLSVVSALMWLRTKRIHTSVNGIPTSRIAYGSAGLMLSCMAVTFILSPSEPIVINGKDFADVLWIKAAGMFLDTVLLLMVVALALVAFGLSGYNRRMKQRR